MTTRVILPAENDGRISCFLADRLNALFYPPFTMMGIEKHGGIIAGVLFNNYEGTDIHATIAGHGWTRRFLREMGRYLFEQIGVERFTGITEHQNVVDIVQRLGGQKEGVLRRHFGPGRDGIVCGVLREEYRYCNGIHSQGTRPGANGLRTGTI